MISIICVYNNKQILDDGLMKNLRNQTAQYELIAIDNTGNRFRSAAAALNHGASQATGEYLMFVHQDVDLSSNTWLAEAEKIARSLPETAIAGLAGVADGKGFVWTNIKHGIPPSRGIGFTDITAPQKVQTLDECLIIVPRPVFNKLRFDETICDDWHLYAVDYCLSARKSGFDAYVIPMFIWHKSIGVLSASYFRTLAKVLDKHRDVRRIYSTTGTWSASAPLLLQRINRSIKAALTSIGIRYLWQKSGLQSLWRRIKT
ncbi:MAG: glycosyltransferase [Planctomycetes bacterium]|nr:glycosyltransferase [Planctomycetota bacterium]